MSGKIEAEKILLEKLFSDDFWFIIPSYQRPYVWTEDNINELLDDLFYAFATKDKNEYFLGALVLKRRENHREFEVLDGQQRLTTFCMLVATLRDLIEDVEYKNNLQEMLYKKANKLKGIESKSKLSTEIRSDVEKFINNFIMNEDGTLNESSLNEYTTSNNISIKNMAKVLLALKKELLNKSSKELEEFASFLNGNAMFIYVSTDNTEDAFRLFTILNNRGVPLTTSDILKSYNLGKISENKRDDYARKWEELEENFGDKFDRFLNFIRTILVKDKARKNLLEEFEEEIYKKNKLEMGIGTIDLLEKYDSHYEKLINFNDGNLNNATKNLITIMKAGFNSEDWIPPLLYYFDKYKHENIFEFVKKLDNKFAGDWISRQTPTYRFESMSNIIRLIEKSTSSEEVIENTEVFKVDKNYYLEQLSGRVYGERYSKYLLLKAEFLQRDNEMVHINSYNNLSVEHVLPQNPKEDSLWKTLFSEEEREEFTHKLGNLVLINKRKNSKLSNSDFEVKKEKYLVGNMDIFKSSKVFLESCNTWDKETISKRQDLLLELFKNNL